MASRLDNATYESNTDDYVFKMISIFSLCALSLLVNTQIVVCIIWVKNPLKPTVILTISLAIVDALGSATYVLRIIINSYVEVVLEVIIPCPLALSIEICWYSCIVIGTYHLLALSTHHYVSIVQPLKYKGKVTRKKTFLSLVLLWSLPTVYFIVYFIAAGDWDFWHLNCKEDSFLNRLLFKIILISIISIPLVVMVYFYWCIVYEMRQQNIRWMKLSRSGSSRNRRNSNPRSDMHGHVKMMITTLLILTSYVVGLVPSLLVWVLICPEYCPYSPAEIQEYSYVLSVSLNILNHALIILKSLINPFIYSSRMKEFQEARNAMCLSIKRKYYKIFKGTDIVRHSEFPSRMSVSTKACEHVQEHLFNVESTTGSVEDYSETINTAL